MPHSVASDAASLSDLANLISSSAHTLENASGTNDKTPESAQDARINLLEACRKMIDTVTGPTEKLKNMALIDKHNLASLNVINHYQIALIVPHTGRISFTEIAEKCGLQVDIIARILRQAMTYGVFHEPEIGYVAHTEASLEVPRLAPLFTYQIGVCLPSSTRLLDWVKEGEKKEEVNGDSNQKPKAKSPFQLAHSTTDTWWAYAEKRPELIQNYGKYMALITSGGPHDVNHVAEGYDWESLGDATVVDIGGADGFVAVTLAERYPNLQVVVQDNANLKEVANANIPDSLKSRVNFVAHSFFESQPQLTRQADLFLLRHILHDWADDDCLVILRQLTRTMKSGASILIAEQVLKGPGEIHGHTERVMRALDMQMMTQFGSKERTLDDWVALFKTADPSLKIVNLVQPPGSADTFLEIKRD